MIKERIWEIKPINPPLLNKKCNRCTSNTFYCSEKFRMNAQKKSIDIWLIYRCSKCDNTYNMTIFSRTKSELLDKGLFDKFSENNKWTAWEYAFSTSIGQKNKVEIDFNSVEFQVDQNGLSLADILNADSKVIIFQIKYPFDFNLKMTTLIKACLHLSTKQIQQLIDAKAFSIQGNYLHKKQKVRNEDIVQIDIARFRSVSVV